MLDLMFSRSNSCPVSLTVRVNTPKGISQSNCAGRNQKCKEMPFAKCREERLPKFDFFLLSFPHSPPTPAQDSPILIMSMQLQQWSILRKYSRRRNLKQQREDVGSCDCMD